jgi:integrase
LTALTHIDVAQWVQRLQLPNARGKIPSAKTVTNKHGFVAGALNAAVSHNPPIIPANPCTGLGMPNDDDPREMIFLTREQFALLHSKVTEYWQPLTEFLVASGARWGEVVALRPGDVDRGAGTVRIRQSWKQGSGGYRLGTTKTKKGKRTINVPKAVLDKLDYSEEFLFTNRAGGPVRAQGFYNRVWAPALERAWPSVDGNGESVKDKSKVLRPRVHDLRHTCASWMLQARPPVPAVGRIAAPRP